MNSSTLYTRSPTRRPEERNRTWLELEHKYRPWNDFDGLPFYGHGAGWQRQLHIYEHLLISITAWRRWRRCNFPRTWQIRPTHGALPGAGKEGRHGHVAERLLRAAGFAVPFGGGRHCAGGPGR